jgi:hypothetical protein
MFAVSGGSGALPAKKYWDECERYAVAVLGRGAR